MATAAARPTVFLAGTKHRRESVANSSATSRKNKLQRCSVCGGLGHKSRTCELTPVSKEHPHHYSSSSSGGEFSDASSYLSGSASMLDPAPDYTDPRTVLAAYGLLTLSAANTIAVSSAPPHWRPPQQQLAEQRFANLWQALSPHSPRLLVT